MFDNPAPAVGQVWRDADPRTDGRFLRITAVDALRVTARRVAWDPEARIAVELPGARPTYISRDRLRPTRTGYRYVGDPS